jgi:sulfoxide reductase heme-binding subunit YedZ
MILSTRFKTRAKHHAILITATGLLLLTFIKLIPGDDLKYLGSMATGYVSIILLAITLLIGPFNMYLKKPNPVSNDLRRDTGIWCGFIGLAHIVFGIQVHMGNIFLYFFKAVDGNDAYKFRDDIFGAANYTGLVAGLILLILLFLSNDLSLQWLKTKRWKNIQRWNYLLFALVVIHGILFQIIEKRIMVIIILFSIIMIIPMFGQLLGFNIIKKSKQL